MFITSDQRNVPFILVSSLSPGRDKTTLRTRRFVTLSAYSCSPSSIFIPSNPGTFNRTASSSTGMFGLFEGASNSISIMPRELTVTSRNWKGFWDGITVIISFSIDFRIERSWALPTTVFGARKSMQNPMHLGCGWVEFRWMCMQSTKWPKRYFLAHGAWIPLLRQTAVLLRLPPVTLLLIGTHRFRNDFDGQYFLRLPILTCLYRSRGH